MLTPEQIAEIEQREQAATKGAWYATDPEAPFYDAEDDEDGDDLFVSSVCADTQRDIAEDLYPPDAAFIAHAREDIPALLADRRELVAEVERLRAVERMARQYVDADPQVRGECYRELVVALNPPQEGKQ